MANTPRNPAQPAELVANKAKIVVWGDPGTGKSAVGLSFPKPVVVDMEASTNLFPGRPHPVTRQPVQFGVVRTKQIGEILELIDFLKYDQGRTYETLVIDPVTALWQAYQDGGQQAAEARAAKKGWSTEDVVLTQRDWGLVKRRLYTVMSDLSNLPIHVILVAHVADLNETRKNNKGEDIQIKIGEKPDAEKKLSRWPHFIFKMSVNPKDGGFSAVCEKQKGDFFRIGQVVPNLSYIDFAPTLAAMSEGAHVEQQREEDVVNANAAVIDLETPHIVKPQPSELTPAEALATEYKRLFSKAVDLGLDLTKDGHPLPPAIPPTSAKLPAAVEYIRNLVTQAEDMADTSNAVAA